RPPSRSAPSSTPSSARTITVRSGALPCTARPGSRRSRVPSAARSGDWAHGAPGATRPAPAGRSEPPAFVDNRAATRLDASMPRSALLALLLALHACGGGGEKPPPSAPPAKASASTPRRDPLVAGPYPAILIAQAQFVEGTGADGKPTSVPGPAKLTIVRKTENGWKPGVIEDPDSNVFHTPLGWDGGVLTIGGTQALLRTWRFADGAWKAETRWNPKFGGKFDRLRDIEVGDVDGDGKDDLVVATHDQGVIAVLHP